MRQCNVSSLLKKSILKKTFSFLLGVGVFLLVGCHSEFDSDDSDGSSDDSTSELALNISASDEVVLGSDMAISVTSTSQDQATSFALTSSEEQGISDVHLDFDDSKYNDDFLVSYSDGCKFLTNTNSCVMMLMPTDESINDINNNIDYTISGTESNGKIISEDYHLKLEELELLDSQGQFGIKVGSGNDQILKLVNDTDVSVDVSGYQFLSNSDDLSFNNNQCDGTLLPNESCQVDLDALNEAEDQDAIITVKSQDKHLVGQYNAQVERPNIEITPDSVELIPYDSKVLTIKNNSGASANDLDVLIPQISDVTATSDCANILDANQSCHITFKAENNPNSNGQQQIKITGSNFNEADATIIALTPQALNVSLSTDHIVANSQSNKQVIVNVQNGQSYDLTNLNLLMNSNDMNLEEINYLSSCENITELKPNESCQYILDYTQGNLIEKAQYNDYITINASASQSVTKSIQINQYPEFFLIPDSFSKVITTLPSNAVKSIFVDGTTWYVATNAGLSISSDQGESFDTIQPNKMNNLTTTNAKDVVVLDGVIYYANNAGLAISTDNGKTFTIKTPADGLNSYYVARVAVKGNHVYLATKGGVSISFDQGNSFITKTTDNGLLDNQVNDIFVDENDVIYAATNDGLSISTDNGENFNTLTTDSGLGSNEVRGVFVDQNGTIYAGTTGGLSISKNQHAVDQGDLSFTNKTINDGLSQNTINRIFVDENGVIYAATSQYLSISDDQGQTWKVVTGVEYDNQAYLNDVFVDNTGRIYTAGKSLSVSNDDGSYTHFDASFPNGILNDISYSDNTIYLASNDGVYISSDYGKTWFISNTNNGLMSRYVQKILKHKGVLYASAQAALSISNDNGKTWQNKTTTDGLGSNFTNEAAFDSEENLYVATSNGLSISKDDGGSFTTINASTDGLLSNDIQGIVIYNDIAYLATDSGLSIWDIKNNVTNQK